MGYEDGEKRKAKHSVGIVKQKNDAEQYRDIAGYAARCQKPVEVCDQARNTYCFLLSVDRRHEALEYVEVDSRMHINLITVDNSL